VSKTRRKSVFQESALLSGLVSQEQIDQVVAEVHAEPDRLPTPVEELSDEELAAKLVESQVLTRYQADQLKAGRTKLNLGPYTITDWIGQGGMGQVFKAVHKMMGRHCAVKVLPRDKSTPEAIENFTREIRTQAQLDHANLVRAYDAGHDGNVHYLVTEYVPGTDLRQLVRRQGPLTMQQAANVIMQAAHGLEYAHQGGLIHRDVKPGNILVTPEGIAKVSDLGLSGFVHDAENDPRAGKIVGTADYLSPEQISNPNEITSVSDIYSLGCTLYYAVSGKVPFPGGTTRDKARRHCEETPWHPRRFNPEVSEEFVEIIADMMEKDPKARIQTAAEVAARLSPWATEAAPVPSEQLTKSPWMPPPLPTDADDELQDTYTGSDLYEDLDSRVGNGSSSQVSQTTARVGSSRQETRRLRRVSPPPLPLHRRPAPSSSSSSVLLALAIAIPASMLIGAVLTLLLMAMMAMF
jgi:serine/threonine protein kinase